ncbi:MAG: hypothetical protein AB7Q23_12245 [Hyphomonadaceae bacterium]
MGKRRNVREFGALLTTQKPRRVKVPLGGGKSRFEQAPTPAADFLIRSKLRVEPRFASVLREIELLADFDRLDFFGLVLAHGLAPDLDAGVRGKPLGATRQGGGFDAAARRALCQAARELMAALAFPRTRAVREVVAQLYADGATPGRGWPSERAVRDRINRDMRAG